MSGPQLILMYYNGSAEATCALNRTGELALSCGGVIHGLIVADTGSVVVSSVGLLSDIAYSAIVSATSVIRGEGFSNFAACKDHPKKNNILSKDEEVKNAPDPQHVMLSYKSQGGTAPEAVKAMLDKFTETWEAHRRHLQDDQCRVATAYETCRTIAREASCAKSAVDLERLLRADQPQRTL